MRKSLLLIFFLLSIFNIFAQSSATDVKILVIKTVDGHTTKFNIADIEELTFEDSCGDDDSESAKVDIVGTWKNIGGANYDLGITVYVQFKVNGDYAEVDIDDDGVEIKKGRWEMEGNLLTAINHVEEWGIDIPLTLTVEKLTKSELTVVVLGFKEKFTKVSDKEIEQYLK